MSIHQMLLKYCLGLKKLSVLEVELYTYNISQPSKILSLLKKNCENGGIGEILSSYLVNPINQVIDFVVFVYR